LKLLKHSSQRELRLSLMLGHLRSKELVRETEKIGLRLDRETQKLARER
jgi:hypothetical protein